MRAKFFGERVGHSVQSPLRGGVSRAFGQRVLSGEGGDVDDVSGAGANHQRSESADGKINAAQIRIENALPVFRRKFMQQFGESADASIVDQDVKASESAIDASSGVFELVQQGDVAGNDLGFASGRKDGARSGVKRGLGASAKHCGGAESWRFGARSRRRFRGLLR